MRKSYYFILIHINSSDYHIFIYIGVWKIAVLYGIGEAFYG